MENFALSQWMDFAYIRLFRAKWASHIRQLRFAPALLDLFRNVLLQDTAYVERVKRHYAMFRQEVDNKAKRVVQGKKRRKRKRKKRKA